MMGILLVDGIFDNYGYVSGVCWLLVHPVIWSFVN